jgi:hypothetical protein
VKGKKGYEVNIKRRRARAAEPEGDIARKWAEKRAKKVKNEAWGSPE